MQEDMSRSQEKAVLALVTRIASITDLNILLNVIVQELPSVVGATGCWIYLQPRYVPEYKGLLKLGEKEISEADLTQVFKDFIVLAATNLESKKPLIGKAFFGAGEGVIGWVYKNGKPLRIVNFFDDAELKSFSPDLNWASKYYDSDELYRSGDKRRLLTVPLVSDESPIGALELDGAVSDFTFSDFSQASASIVANFSASAINNLYVSESRKHFLISLAHEINTPLTGILADSENLYQELPSNTEFHQTAKHIFGQVLRLHMQTATLMSVLSEPTAMRQFSEHSIYRPLKEACELFESEALQKGLAIIGPKARDGNFPNIEMSLFDLTIAFKNVIHNAVKYSYRPPKRLDLHRTIKVWGEWDSKRKGYYSIFIQNYGVGIMPFEIEKRLIFEPYYRGEKASDRSRTGAGLGLAHARSVIEDLHHGHISVTSIHQSGDAFLTTFIISLPVKQPKNKNGGLNE